MSDWASSEQDYLGELGRRPAARPGSTLGEVWDAEWTRSGLDTISGVGRPFTEAYDELRTAIEEKSGSDIATLAYRNGVNMGAASTSDLRIHALNALADTLPEEQRKEIEPLRDVRRRASDKAQSIEREASEVTAASPGLSATATAFLAGTARQFADPFNLVANVVTAPIGGPFKGPLLKVVARQAAAGGAAQLFVEPYIEASRGELGLESGIGHGAMSVAQAALGGAGFAGLLRAGRAGYDLLRSPRVAPEAPGHAAAPDLERTFIGYMDHQDAEAFNRGEPMNLPETHPLADLADVPGFQRLDIAEAAAARPTRERVPLPPPVEFEPTFRGSLEPEDVAAFDRGEPLHLPETHPLTDLGADTRWPGFDGLSHADIEAAARFAERDQYIERAAPPSWDPAVHHAMVDEGAAALEAGRPVDRAKAAERMAEQGIAAPGVAEVAGNPLSEAIDVRPGRRFGIHRTPEEKLSLFQYLASRGGVRADDPLINDLLGSTGTNPFIPGYGQLVRKPRRISTAARRGGGSEPMTLDQAREAAALAGFLDKDSKVTDLLDLAAEEARGNKQYRPGQEPARGLDPDEQKALRQAAAVQREGEFDARMTQLEITKIAKRDRVRALQIMEKEGQADPLLAFEQALAEHEAKQEAIRAARQKQDELYIPGWDVADDAGPASRHGEDAAGQPGSRPGGDGPGGEPRPDREGAGTAGEQGQLGALGDPALKADAERAIAQAGDDFEITIKLPDGSTRTGRPDALLKQAEDEAAAASELFDCIGIKPPAGAP